MCWGRDSNTLGIIIRDLKMYRGETKSLVFLLMAISSEKLCRSKNNSGVIKFALLRLFPKSVQINPKADNIRANSNNGYVHYRDS